MTHEQRHTAGDTGSKGIPQIFSFRIYTAGSLGRELSFPQDVDGRGSGQPHCGLGAQSFQGQGSFPLAPAVTSRCGRCNRNPPHGLQKEASFLWGPGETQAASVDLKKWGSFFVCSWSLNGARKTEARHIPSSTAVGPSPSGKWDHVNKSRPKALLRCQLTCYLWFSDFHYTYFWCKGLEASTALDKTPSTIKLMLQQLLRDTKLSFHSTLRHVCSVLQEPKDSKPTQPRFNWGIWVGPSLQGSCGYTPEARWAQECPRDSWILGWCWSKTEKRKIRQRDTGWHIFHLVPGSEVWTEVTLHMADAGRQWQHPPTADTHTTPPAS